MPFDDLHPAVQHHVVNSLGWAALRPLQEEAIAPILRGDNALLLAPTAGGKTEAAVLPVLSRMLSEGWSGLSVLYLCPLRALLNNLHVRLDRLTSLVGRRAALWHADVGDGERRAILSDPPDILLTTPESLEVMLVARREHRHDLFGSLRVAVIDELHAFASDDRGWHLLSVLERIARLSGRDVQRLGLSATIGNPAELLAWLAGSSNSPRCLVAPDAGVSAAAAVGIDFVGSLANAATMISRLHHGEKRLVFCDSRAAVEQLAAELRQADVQTFVSHSSLSADERRRAEEAFASASNCVIVATSTLELGIDVGDLDRVIQIDAPGRVSSFLQRLGRTGRRSGTSRNCLFLATDDDTLLRACGLVELWREGFVEPVVPPPSALNVYAQQILGLVAQEGRVIEEDLAVGLGGSGGFASIPNEDRREVVRHMVSQGYLASDGDVLTFGPTAESAFGGRRYRELFSVFDSEPLFAVFHGRTELGRVHESTFLVSGGGEPTLLLAGRSWLVTRVDWRAGEAFVEPAQAGGLSKWRGSGQPMHHELCQAIRRVLTGRASREGWSQRALGRIASLGEEFEWLPADGTVLVRDGSPKTRWWTFGGQRANAALVLALGEAGWPGASAADLFVVIPEAKRGLEDALRGLRKQCGQTGAVSEQAIERLKFGVCLPKALAMATLCARSADEAGLESVLRSPVTVIHTLK